MHLENLSLSLVLLAGLVLGSCQSTEESAAANALVITSTSNPSVRIPATGTYSWMDGSMIVSDPRLSEEIYPILMSEIERGLARRGYHRIVGGQPDLLIGVVAALAGTLDDEEISMAYGLDSTWLPKSLSKDEYEQGTVVLDVAVARTGRSLWRGAVHAAAKFERPADERRERVERALESLLERFDEVR